MVRDGQEVGRSRKEVMRSRKEAVRGRKDVVSGTENSKTTPRVPSGCLCLQRNH